MSAEEATAKNGAVLPLSVVGAVFASVGLMGSLIPCLGWYAIYIAVPGLIMGVVALLVAMQAKMSLGFPIVVICLSLAGAGLAWWQLERVKTAVDDVQQSITETAQELNDNLKKTAEELKQEIKDGLQ